MTVRASRWPLLRRRRVVANAEGLSAHGLRRRHWSWKGVAVIAHDSLHGASYLAVCLHGDPYVRSLPVRRTNHDAMQRPLANSKEALRRFPLAVLESTESAAMWWSDDPRSHAHDA
jgi:hypothetical protein